MHKMNRPYLIIGNMFSREGFWRLENKFFEGILDGFQGKFVQPSGQKNH